MPFAQVTKSGLTARDSAAHPFVIAQAHEWGRVDSKTLGAIRSELRTLGVSLAIATDHGWLRIRPDDHLSSSRVQDQLRSDRIFRSEGSGAPPDRSLTVSLYDAEGQLRFWLTVDTEAGVLEALLEILRTAGRSAYEARWLTNLGPCEPALPRPASDAEPEPEPGARPPAAQPLSHCEVVTLSLIGALAMTLFEGSNVGAGLGLGLEKALGYPVEPLVSTVRCA